MARCRPVAAGGAPLLGREARRAYQFYTRLFPPQEFGCKVDAVGRLVARARVAETTGSREANGEVVCALFIRDQTLFVEVPFLEDGSDEFPLDLKQTVVALMELAEEQLHCARLTLCLSRKSPTLMNTVRSLMYVGFQPVPPPSPTIAQDLFTLQYDLAQ